MHSQIFSLFNNSLLYAYNTQIEPARVTSILAAENDSDRSPQWKPILPVSSSAAWANHISKNRTTLLQYIARPQTCCSTAFDFTLLTYLCSLPYPTPELNLFARILSSIPTAAADVHGEVGPADESTGRSGTPSPVAQLLSVQESAGSSHALLQQAAWVVAPWWNLSVSLSAPDNQVLMGKYYCFQQVK